MTAWFGLRSSEARNAWKAFVTLAGMMAGHAMLETARDTLFLSRVPAEQLPWAYLMIAGLALLLTKANRWVLKRVSLARALTLSLLFGVVVNVGFYFERAANPLVLSFALYVWTGLFATVAVVQFWLLQAEALDVEQAKRSFAFIGAGGLVGAVVGSSLAGLLLMRFEPSVLILGSAALLGITAFLPRARATAAARIGEPRAAAVVQRRGGNMRLIQRDRYLLRLFSLGLIATLVVTGVDYLFKATLSATVPAARLGSAFALFYTLTNALALLVQLALAPRLLRSLGVTRALLLLPLLLCLGSVGFLGLAGIIPVLVLKGADSALRFSVHKTSTEILFLPLKSSVRERFKGVAEALGQRGGQALASVGILAATAAGASLQQTAYAVLALSVLWVGSVVGLRPLYVERFRANLRAASIDTNVQVQELELHSLEALLASLSSEDDNEVIGALDMFADYGKTNLIPALILYHPSVEVVIRAFELFTVEHRSDVERLTHRLLRHENPPIRAAALRYLCATGVDANTLRDFLEDRDPEVRVTAIVELVAHGYADASESTSVLTRIIAGGSPEMRLALARSSRHLPADRFAWVVDELSRISEKGLAAELARAIALTPDLAHIPTLIRLVGERTARESARDALLALGEPALEALGEAVFDTQLNVAVRRHLPRTISRFGGQASVELLLKFLDVEQDERVVFKILRGLGRLRASDPSLLVDRVLLLRHARDELDRAQELLAAKLVLLRGCPQLVRDKGTTMELLVALLGDAHISASERLFRVLHAIYPQHELGTVYAALNSGNARLRAESRELLDNILPNDLRGPIQALMDEGSDSERVRRMAALRASPRAAYLQELGSEPSEDVAERVVSRLLFELMEDRNDAIRRVAAHAASEIGIDEPLSVRQPRRVTEPSAFDDLLRGAVRLLSGGVPSAS
ncbi:MAG: HEAT repeat domain-containing protein [Polyangiaceae bacterium]